MDLQRHHFSQNTNEKLSGFLPCIVRAEVFTIFCSYFRRNDDFINWFWNWLTFSGLVRNDDKFETTKCTMGQKNLESYEILIYSSRHFSLPSFLYLIKWYMLIIYVSTKYVFVSYLVKFVCLFVCLFVDIEKTLFTNQITDQVKNSFDESYNFLFARDIWYWNQILRSS